jgi:hypothetical protein
MELGTALFLSATLLCVTALIILTRDKVRWGRWLLVVVLGTVVVGGIAGVLVYIVNSYEWRRAVATRLGDVSLGDLQSDVRFRKGIYSERCLMDGTQDRIQVQYSSGEEPNRKLMWIEFRNEKVVSITVARDMSYLGPTLEIPLSEYDTEETLREKWGPEDFIRTISESVRHYVYRRYQFSAVLFNNRVVAMTVFNPDLFYLDASVPPKRATECYDSEGKLKK